MNAPSHFLCFCFLKMIQSIFQLYWGIVDKQNCNKFKVYNVIWYTYTSWKDSYHPTKLTHCHLTYLSFVVEDTSSTLSKFQLYKTALSTVVTMLYITSSDLKCPLNFISSFIEKNNKNTFYHSCFESDLKII